MSRLEQNCKFRQFYCLAILLLATTCAFPQNPPRFQALSREVSIFTDSAPASPSEAITREVSIIKSIEPLIRWEAVGKEYSILSSPSPANFVESVSREFSIIKHGFVPPEIGDSISREWSLAFAQGEPPFPTVAVTPTRNPDIGTDVTFFADATGTPPFQFQWRYNGENIPGANSPQYTIRGVRPEDSGAYRCLLVNQFGGAYSALIDLQVQVPLLFLSDLFAERPVHQQPEFQGFSSNAQAAPNEPGEPRHGNKSGGRSMWMTWRAAARGVAKFSTAGSNFDTVLAVYTGNTIGQLALVTSDDDSGGYFTSELEFPAEPGVDYHIVVDGFAESIGRIVLTWDLQASGEEFPRIISEPQSLVVTEGAAGTLTVAAAGSASLSYEWLLNGQALAGQSQSSLSIASISSADVGSYRVRVGAGNNFVLSEPAEIEISSALDAAPSKDKVEDLLDQAGARQAAGSAFPIVSAGVIGYQLINNFGASISQSDPNFPNEITTGSKWAGVTAQSSGMMLLDTIGSEIDTVLAVYPANANLLTAQPIAADDNSAPDGIRSRLLFSAEAGKSYMVVAAGVKGQQGKIQINWLLGTAPIISSPLQNQAAPMGDSVLFSVAAAGIPAPSYQWVFRRAILAGQKDNMLQLSELELTDFGLYRVEVSNPFGRIFSQANLELIQLFGFSGNPRILNDRVIIDFAGGTLGKVVVFEISEDLKLWTPVLTNSGVTNFRVEIPVAGDHTFFRARE